MSKCHDLRGSRDNIWGTRKFPASLRILVVSLKVICNNMRVTNFLRMALLLCHVLQRFVTIVDLRYQSCIGHCPLSAVYLVGTIFRYCALHQFFVIGSDILKDFIFTFFFLNFMISDDC